MDSKNNLPSNNISSKGIRKKVNNSYSIALKRYKIDSIIFLDLDKILNEVYCSLRPVPVDYKTRKELVDCLNAMARDIYGNSKDNSPVLEAYGSFVMDMFSPQSDLDISISFGNKTCEIPRDKKLQILRSFAKKLCSLEGSGYVRNVDTIFSARVPIVKFFDQGTSIECDLSIENKNGILNSQIIHIISQIDDRYQRLCMLVKRWAKAHEVNSALHRTLNSVSITLLVAFHLQTQDPPILPPFSILFKDGIDPSNVKKRTHKFLNWGWRNHESIGRLFATFFIKLQSVEFLWRQGLCASVLNGHWISKKWKKACIGSISIEDFTNVSENVARRVNGEGAKKIYESINGTVEDLFEFLDGKVTGTHLSHRLFGEQAVVEPPPPPPFVPQLMATGTHLRHRLFGQQGVMEPPLPPALQHIVYRKQPQDYYKNSFSSHPEEHHNKRVRLENGYKTVEQGDHGREEERYENLRGKQKRYTGSYNGFEEFHEIPRLGIHNKPLEDLYRQVPLSIDSVRHLHDGRSSGKEQMPVCPLDVPYRQVPLDGHLFRHRDDSRFSGHEPQVCPLDNPYGRVPLDVHLVHLRDAGRFRGEEPTPRGLWQDFSHRINPPLPSYGRARYEDFDPLNLPQPYFGRP